MTELERVVNIGAVLAGHLRKVGVADFEQLAEMGAFAAARRLEAAGMHDCTHAYLALEGAIAGVRWSRLPPERRAELAECWRSRGADGMTEATR